MKVLSLQVLGPELKSSDPKKSHMCASAPIGTWRGRRNSIQKLLGQAYSCAVYTVESNRPRWKVRTDTQPCPLVSTGMSWRVCTHIPTSRCAHTYTTHTERQQTDRQRDRRMGRGREGSHSHALMCTHIHHAYRDRTDNKQRQTERQKGEGKTEREEMLPLPG